MSAHYQALKPEPLRRYSVPKYPSYQDPDPTLYPRPVPYPFKTGAISVLTGLGLATSTLSLAGDADEGVKPSDNPFRLALSGLPHRTSPFGTGAPSYIQDKVARKAIDKVFADEGIKLQKGYQYNHDGVAFIADGYNEKLKLGYVFGGWRTLDQDAIISWMTRSEKEGDSLSTEQLKKRLQWLSYTDDADLKMEIEKTAKIEDETELRVAYDQLIEKIGKQKLSLSEAHLLEKHANEGKEFIAVVSQYDRRFVSSRWGRLPPDELEAETKRIKTLETAAEKEEAMRMLEMRMSTDGLQALEKAVRQYIQWARSQGVQ